MAPARKAAARKAIEAPPAFQIDTAGDSSVRNSLLHAAASNPAAGRLRKGTSFTKVLKSDAILAARSNVPALTSRAVPSALTVVRKDREKMGRVDRATKDRLRRMTGRDGEGQGLWALKSSGPKDELLTEAMRPTGTYDAWEVKVERVIPGEDLGLKAIVKANTEKATPKPPSTLHEHPLLAAGGGPRAVPLPHPGMSYNPSQSHHQALLGKALTHYTAVEDREERGQPIKDAMDEARKAMKGLEPWEIYEQEVGSGEEDSGAEEEDPEALELRLKKKLSKRKTKQQRSKKVLIAAEALALSLRRAARARNASVVNAKAVNVEIGEELELSLAEKALTLKIRKARVAERGLTRLRSGPSKVPDQPVTYQLGEELADNLRTLTPEGNLWREWVGSSMRRGKLSVERANESKKGGKRGGRGKDKGSKTKEVGKFAWKRFE